MTGFGSSLSRRDAGLSEKMKISGQSARLSRTEFIPYVNEHKMEMERAAKALVERINFDHNFVSTKRIQIHK